MLNLKALACGVAIGALALTSVAQPAGGGGKDTKQPGAKNPDKQPRGEGRGQGGPGGMEQLSADKAKAAWDLEATGVANRLKLTGDQTKALVSAYENARTSQQSAME